MMNLFHLVKVSFWPLFVGVMGLGLVSSIVFWFKFFSSLPLLFLATFLFVILSGWWRDVSFESLGGEYSGVVIDGLKMGMLLFILSEVWFFSAFFWCFFHSSLVPLSELGEVWPPLGILGFNPFHVPLLNTIVLLSSGLTVTWSHHSLLCNSEADISLGFTLLLGFYFTGLQGFEYYSSCFTISDSVYGSIFFIGTGFHGLHVLVGTLFLAVCFYRLLVYHLTTVHHLGYEMAIWYWHFVDVVWLFLFSFIYWWGS